MALVLVVEHFEPLRRILRRVLESRQHRVLLAADGVEGLELWHERGAQVVILDLPGWEEVKVLRQFRASAPMLPIIVTSAGDPTARFDMLGEALRIGATAVLMKPFHLPEVVDLVSRVTGNVDGPAE